MPNPYRDLPAVDALVTQLQANPATPAVRHERLVAVCRAVLDEARLTIQQTGQAPDPEALARQVQAQLAAERQLALRPVINATGVIIHTNLGRAPLSEAAQQAIQAVAGGYSTLEFDLASGQRGHRDSHFEELLTTVTGAEAALVVNNNAAAVYLVLSALARDREVIISRSELVEIGGGFRIPDVMAASGAHLIEVGTTNRTRLDDFAAALSERTAALLRVHASNFKLVGFTQRPDLAELASLAQRHGCWLLDDIGSGAVLDTTDFGLDAEPTVKASLAAGADLVLFSGDKLLGGPQAGIIAGQRDLVERLRRFPLTRALRPDKLCLAGLAATVRHYRDDDPLRTVPVWRMIALPLEDIAARARVWQQAVGGTVQPAQSTVGGGSLPGNTLPTHVLSLAVDDPDDVAARLRATNPPVIARISDDQVLLDPRTVLPEQDEVLIGVLKAILKE